MVYPNRVVLNINQKYVMPIPYTQQGDTARILTFNILDKGVPFNLSGKTVRAKILKPDNTKCYNDLTITNATGGECDLKLTNQVLAVAGKVNCQLEIKEGEELLSTIIFPIDVEPSIDINGAVESTNEFTALLNGIIKLDEWDKYFKETSGAIEEKYTERLNGIDSSLEERVKKNELTLNIKDFGAKGNGVDNDNLAFIQCFDYAKSLSTLTTDGNKIKILIPYGLYVISNLVVPRNLNIECEGVLIVEGEGNVGLLCNMTLFSTLSHITIKLTQNNQKALVLTSSETTSSQLNTFNCLTVEGQHLLNSVGISLGRTWSNTFFSCKVFRCAKSLEFTDADSNANIFYNCELRSEKDSQNSIVAIHHLNGKNNMFIGGIIENYKECLINDNGDFKLIGVYTEDFKDDRGIILNGGSLTIDNSLLKTKIKINGGETLRLINIDGNRGALYTNTNSPLIMFYADVDTEIITENNNFPNELILCRYGQYFNGSDWITKSKNRDKIKSNEIYSYGVEGEITSVTGDNTDATIIFNKELINNTNLKEYDVSNGIFTPKYGGLFKVNVQCRLSNISSDNTDIVLFLKESNGKVFRLDNKKYEDRDNGNNVLLKGEAIVPLINLKNLRVSVRGNGTSKNINVSGGTGNNIFSWITIQRI